MIVTPLLLATLATVTPSPLPAPLAKAQIRQAGPTITVRGNTRVELEKIDRVPSGVMITVRLVDADLGEGIADKSVTLQILQDGQMIYRATGTTSKNGSAQIFVPHHRGEYDLKLDFSGDTLYVAATPAATLVDLSKEAISLRISAPPKVDVGGRAFSVSVSARHHSGIPGLRVKVQFLRKGELVRAQRGSTDQEGRFGFTIRPVDLGGAGELSIVATSSTTENYNSARAEQRLFMVSDVRITFGLSRRSARKDSGVTASGRVTDASGPVEAGAVHIIGAGRRLAVARTDKGGRYRMRLDLHRLPLGELHLVARFVPRTAWRRTATSKSVILKIEPPKPIPMAYFLIPAAVTLLFLLGVLVVRRRPWEHWKRRLQSRRESRPVESSGIELGRRRSFRSLFAVEDQTISGTVYDVHKLKPIPNATVYLRAASPGHTDMETRTNPDGSFALTDVAAGTWNLVATSPGWIPQSLMVDVPHRGELHGLTIRLESIRQRVMQIYSDVVRPLLPEPILVRYWTPSESTDHIQRHLTLPPPGLSDLSALAEHTYYSPAVPNLSAVQDAESLAQAAMVPPAVPETLDEPAEADEADDA